MLNRLPIPLPPLLLENKLHRALRMLHHRRFDLDFISWDDRVPAYRVFSRTQLVDLFEPKDIPRFEMWHVWDCEEISWG